MNKTTSSNSALIPIILSFAAVYIIWGAAYLFVAVTVEEISPFLMSGLRYTTASLLLFGLLALFRQYESMSRQQIKNAAFAGFLFVGCGTGGVAWALQYVDSGFTALVISGEPLLVVLMMWAIDKKRPATQSFIGIFLGMLGMFLLVNQSELVAQPEQWKGILAIFISMIAWGFGSIFVSKADLPKPQMANSGIQMLMGGFLLFLGSLFFENPFGLQVQEVSLKAWLALACLSVFGSVVAFSAFNYLLSKVSPEKVATATYINPIIALILGWWLRDELVTTQSIVAAGIMFTGVFFINSSPERSKNLMRRFRLIGKRRV